MKYRIIKKWNWAQKDFMNYAQVQKSILGVNYWKTVGYHFLADDPITIQWCREDIDRHLQRKKKYSPSVVIEEGEK